MEWEILMTVQVEEFLDTLYEADRTTHRLGRHRRAVPKSGSCSSSTPGDPRFCSSPVTSPASGTVGTAKRYQRRNSFTPHT